jgi:hypothetical protein
MTIKAAMADALGPAEGVAASPAPPPVPIAAGEEVHELRAKVAQLQSQLAHQITASKREQESLLKLVIGMATGGYRFDRRAVRSRVTKEITDDLLDAGVSLDEATILKHLRRASELLPAED